VESHFVQGVGVAETICAAYTGSIGGEDANFKTVSYVMVRKNSQQSGVK
jgi:hypothetical protein